MERRYFGDVLMTIAVLLRSGVMGNYHAPFWRAVEGVTPSLTLILRDYFLASGSGVLACGDDVRPKLETISGRGSCH